MSLFILLAGFIIGLGAVTVIDICGFLGRKSPYWNETTIRVHKVTKPLIWVGTILVVIGGILMYKDVPILPGAGTSFTAYIPLIHTIAAVCLILNGCFLSFWLSPRLLKRERDGLSREVLPASLQRKVAVSLIVSDIGWWGSLILLVVYLQAGMTGTTMESNSTTAVRHNPRTVSALFVCKDSKTIDATFINTDSRDTNTVNLTLSDRRQLSLNQTISASGARYANINESFVFWNKGNTAFIEEEGVQTFSDCATQE